MRPLSNLQLETILFAASSTSQPQPLIVQYLCERDYGSSCQKRYRMGLDDYRLSAVGGVITKLKLFLCSEFSSFSLGLCKRLCNTVVLELAVIGCNLSGDYCNTLDSVPQ
jgi:hypothetical protein